MIGTCREVLYALSLKYKWNIDLPLTSQQKKNLTKKIRSGAFGERLSSAILPLYGAVMIREPYYLPALYINENRRIIDEDTLKEIVTSVKGWYVNRFSESKARKLKYKSCKHIPVSDMDKIALNRGYKPYKPRMVFPSIWELKQSLDARYFPKVDLTEYAE